MSEIQLIPSNDYGYNFIPKEYLSEKNDEYYLRNQQFDNSKKTWRQLTKAEISILEKNDNYSSNWTKVLVQDPFLPEQIQHSSFFGLVRIGSVGNSLLRYHDYTMPEGITNSRIISCDIGNHCAIHNCFYMSHYIIGDMSILSRIDELEATNHSKFGNGIVKEGESEDVRIWIDPLNEAGGRSILPFDEIICADAYIWTRYRDDKPLLEELIKITQNSYDTRRGYYGEIGEQTVIKSCGVIKDVKIGSFAYIKGANKLKNLTIKSDKTEMTQIGEGVELVNGIIGFGCRIFYGCKAIRFVMGNNCSLKYGARLIHSILGDNSTISCCEVLNNLVFPGHEQHHNNSFLIATLIMGQSNMAAGATVGSNHNSRGNDGEIIAGRGFWPGLSSTLKHNCHFASYTIITKGNYPAELDIQLPFAMLCDNQSQNRREVMPAYYWMYNMYALERNSWKYAIRDNRKHKVQQIECDYLAPDSVLEMINAMNLLEIAIGKAWSQNHPEEEPDFMDSKEECEKKLQRKGYELLTNKDEILSSLEVFSDKIERSTTPVKILKPDLGWASYKEMLTYFAVKTISNFIAESCKQENPSQPKSVSDFVKAEGSISLFTWVNLGGQQVPEYKVDDLRKNIGNGELRNWEDIHKVYKEWQKEYLYDKARLALAVLQHLYDGTILNQFIWNSLVKQTEQTRDYIEQQVYKTKKKDYTNHFREITYRNEKERDAVLGKVEDNPFINGTRLASKTILDEIHSINW